MSDDELIRRGDALAAAAGLYKWSIAAGEELETAIAALPAVTVGAMIAKVPTRYQTVNGDRLLHEGDLLAALEPVAAPDPALRPTMTDMMVDPDTLDDFMDANPLPPDPAAIREAWEKAYWRMRSYAVHDNDCKLNKPPRFDGPCSCGLTAALEEALALIQKGAADDR